MPLNPAKPHTSERTPTGSKEGQLAEPQQQLGMFCHCNISFSGDGGRLELQTLDSIPWQPSEVRSGHRLIAMPDAMYAILPGMTLNC